MKTETLVIRRRNPDGSFGEAVKPFGGETDSEKMERLEADNAQLIYTSMMKAIAIEELNTSQANLLYQLMTNGVI